jgi:UDP-2,3-diacylglucosamine hydrolase
MSKIYFASDFHLGAPNPSQSRTREYKILRWLNMAQKDASAIYLVGDIFDFWFEYKSVVPKGAVRLLGKIAALVDQGIEVHFFVGNHDIWMFDYFEKELGVQIHRQPLQIKLGTKHFLIAHGDGLGPGDYGYKRLKKVFTNKVCQWLFRWIHPDIGVWIANKASHTSRTAQTEPEFFLGKEKEWLLQYANYKLETNPAIDYFLFGHRHLPLDILLPNHRSRYINLGEWFSYCTYAVFDQNELTLQAFENESYDLQTAQHHHLYD